MGVQVQGIEVGGFDYMTKPFDAVAMKETLERVLQWVAHADADADAYRARRLAELR
jgi:FixJ family two-component response regulator